METTSYSVARNVKTTYYEVHKSGCAHLKMSKRFDFTSTIEARDAVDAAETFEARNDGCYATLGPCVKGGK